MVLDKNNFIYFQDFGHFNRCTCNFNRYGPFNSQAMCGSFECVWKLWKTGLRWLQRMGWRQLCQILWNLLYVFLWLFFFLFFFFYKCQYCQYNINLPCTYLNKRADINNCWQSCQGWQYKSNLRLFVFVKSMFKYPIFIIYSYQV